MKTKLNKASIIFLSIFTPLALVILCFVFDINLYQEGSRTLSYDDEGILFSLTAYDGVEESKMFIKSLGHAWLSIENHTDHPIYLGDCEINIGELLTFSIWMVSGHNGVFYNMEAAFDVQFNRYSGCHSITVNIDESQLTDIEKYIEENGNWTPLRNCSRWSVGLWNQIVGEEAQVKVQTILCTPYRLTKSLCEFDCVTSDHDYTCAGNAFYYCDGERRELELCA